MHDSTSTVRTVLPIFFATLLVACMAGIGIATQEPRDEPADTDPPVEVYVSETLDISNVELTGGGTIGSDQTTFVSVDGDNVFTVDPDNANFDDIESGSYDARTDEDDDPELLVVEPRITDFDVRNERGVDIAGDTVEADDFEEVRITVEYNFAEADRLDLTVESPNGLDLAGNAQIIESGGTVTVDTSEAEPGTYRITVEGSNIEAGSATIEVTVSGGTTASPGPTAAPTSTMTPMPTPTATPTATPEPTATPTPTAIPTATPTTTSASTPTATPSPTATESTGSGFGAIVAFFAILTAVVALRQRE